MGWIKEVLSTFAQQHSKLQLDFWIILGFIGQAMFTLRFFIQWVASKRKKNSIIPVSFWYFSLGGGLILLA